MCPTRSCPDYFLEVFAKDKDGKKVDDRLTCVIQEDVFEKVHAYGDNAAYRSVLFNATVGLGSEVSWYRLENAEK